MLEAAGRAISQLRDPAILGVLFFSIFGAGVFLGVSWFAVAALLDHVRLFETGWLDWLARLVIGLGGIFVTAALFGAVAAVIASFFIDRIARAVERRYYPGLPPARPGKISEQIALGLSFLLITIVLNLLALPVYLVWGANLPLFLALNGYLLGRTYFEMVALRRIDRLSVARLRRTYRFRLFFAGVAIAALSFLPFANLLTPVLATAFMVHIFQDFYGSSKGLPPPVVRCYADNLLQST